jgi:hypothetical protein
MSVLFLNKEVIYLIQQIIDALSELTEGEGYFSIDQAVRVDNDLHLTLTMYKEVYGRTVGKHASWSIICEEVRENNLGISSSFLYLQILRDHPVLFKYNKPYFRILGPEKMAENEKIYGQLFKELSNFLEKYNAVNRIHDFLTVQPGFTQGLISLASGPQEIADIYRKVLEKESMQVTLESYPFIHSDTGTEQILLFVNAEHSLYVVAEHFHITRMD